MINDNPQRGAVFIYILMAVALFAALSYAVSRGSRGGTSALTDEQAKLAAQEIIDYGNTVANAVQKLRLRGCSDTEISFENDVSTVDYTNLNAPSDKSCHVFDLSAGNINFKYYDERYIVPSYSGNIFYRQSVFDAGYQLENIGTIENDLILKINYVNESVCTKINDIVAINNNSGAPPTEDNDIAETLFKGAYGTTVADTIGDDGTGLSGKTIFCRCTASNICQFIQVLIAR